MKEGRKEWWEGDEGQKGEGKDGWKDGRGKMKEGRKTFDGRKGSK
jgi:hypothetical protein